MNFKSEVWPSASFPTEAIVWVSEIDSATNMDEFKSFDSTLGRMIPDFQVLDSGFACALKKLLPADFNRRVCMEEQQAQQDNRFMNGRSTGATADNRGAAVEFGEVHGPVYRVPACQVGIEAGGPQ